LTIAEADPGVTSSRSARALLLTTPWLRVESEYIAFA
jgi:hypothetical protein